jgi:hypothetical protein
MVFEHAFSFLFKFSQAHLTSDINLAFTQSQTNGIFLQYTQSPKSLSDNSLVSFEVPYYLDNFVAGRTCWPLAL